MRKSGLPHWDSFLRVISQPGTTRIPRNVGQAEFAAGVEGIPLGEFANMPVADLSRCNHSGSG